MIATLLLCSAVLTTLSILRPDNRSSWFLSWLAMTVGMGTITVVLIVVAVATSL